MRYSPIPYKFPALRLLFESNPTFAPYWYQPQHFFGLLSLQEHSPGTVDTLLKPENKGTLTSVLTYHVVVGKWDAAAISKMIADGKGMATIKTVSGGTLTAKASGMGVTVTDEKGGVAKVTIADVYQSNGVIHVVDKVLMPK